MAFMLTVIVAEGLIWSTRFDVRDVTWIFPSGNRPASRYCTMRQALSTLRAVFP
jgi:hypothetical protein